MNKWFIAIWLDYPYKDIIVNIKQYTLYINNKLIHVNRKIINY